MDFFSNSVSPAKSARQTIAASWTLPLTFASLALALGSPARSQETRPPAESVTEAARNVREHQSNSTTHPKIFTNDELGGPYLAPSASKPSQESSSTEQTEAPKPPAAGCDNPDAENLKVDLQSTQEEQDQIRKELSYNPMANSGGGVDTKNFKPGSSGVNFGGPPLTETEPPVPARITEVDLDQKIASLTRARRIACDSPGNGLIQTKIDQAEQQLSALQREFDLDHSDYYSQTNYAADNAGKANLDAEQQQIQDLQSEIERLKGELAASKANNP